MKKVITIVGTSLFENYIKHESNDIKDKYDDLKEKLHQEWDRRKKRDVEPIRESVSPWANSNENASAEIRSLLKIQQDVVKEEMDVYLLATDTVLSRLAAEIIQERFKDDGLVKIVSFAPKTDVIAELQIWNKNNFEQNGLKNLFERLDSISKGSRKEDVILNITGGYKGVIPYLSIFAQLKEFRTFYIFEDSEELIEIPHLPVDFEFSIIEENFIAFESFNKDGEAPEKKFFQNLSGDPSAAETVFKDLKGKGLIEKSSDEKVKLTTFGNLLWNEYKELFLSKKFQRQNLLTHVVELKVFEFYVRKYGFQAEANKKDEFEFDVYVETEAEIIAVEVKSGGNVPLWEEKWKENSLEYKIKKGGFAHLLNSGKNKPITLRVVLYLPRAIHESVKRQIKELHDKYPEQTKHLEWYWLKVPDNYKANVNWNAKDKMESLELPT